VFGRVKRLEKEVDQLKEAVFDMTYPNGVGLADTECAPYYEPIIITIKPTYKESIKFDTNYKSAKLLAWKKSGKIITITETVKRISHFQPSRYRAQKYIVTELGHCEFLENAYIDSIEGFQDIIIKE